MEYSSRGWSGPPPPPPSDIVETLNRYEGYKRYKTLVAAIKAAKLDGLLSGPGPFTFFAPDDSRWYSKDVEALFKDPEGQLKQILLYHVLPGKFDYRDLKGYPKTMQGNFITIGSRGYMDPKEAARAGPSITVNRVPVSDAIPCTNGIIYVIKSVLNPWSCIVDTLRTHRGLGLLSVEFTILVSAIKAAKLDGTLSNPGPFTLIAPTDSAFGKLGKDNVRTLLQDPEGRLRQILLGHILQGEYDAERLHGNFRTLQGTSIIVKKAFFKPDRTINNAKILGVIACSNGMIHIYDSVLTIP